MSFLHTLRNTPWLAKLALLWFALTLGAAVASPLVNPQDELLICTSAGMVKVVLNADGSVTTSPSAGVHCPLCVVGGAPPSHVSLARLPVQPVGQLLPTIQRVCLTAASAAPPPARGPPASV